ncbi:hypothetical protein EX30DRAFT_84448 [Ascodesmis nigricans]|uniref:Membrane-associated proteins in eicosanoid and glutathione metabolism n=1 Tax=Ascodesmis nigricans TaxID=341454 RepID=A0A4S2N3B0_9PEZI|nr:hypothetical protein EX30DRAFT_84448 [Ascodesmis nigricans]
MPSTILDHFHTRNLSFYTVPAAYILAIAPHMYTLAAVGKRFDARHPRKLLGKLEGDQTMDSATKARIHRAEAASANGFENLGFFAAAVVAANVAGVETKALNTLSVGYVVSRLVYNLIYVNNTTAAAANSRFGVYLVGVGFVISLFVKAGNAVNALKL